MLSNILRKQFPKLNYEVIKKLLLLFTIQEKNENCQFIPMKT